MKGTTSNGFEFELSQARLNNMELVDALAELEDNPLRIGRVCQLLLGKEQQKRLYDFVRDDEGIVPVDAVESTISEIMSSGSKDLKK